MKHSQNEIDEIWSFTKEGRYAGSSPHHMPKIVSDDDSEQCISIPNKEGSSRELYSSKNADDFWRSVPYVGDSEKQEVPL